MAARIQDMDELIQNVCWCRLIEIRLGLILLGYTCAFTCRSHSCVNNVQYYRSTLFLSSSNNARIEMVGQ